MSERDVDFVIVGGGDAGFSAARALREEGADGSIVIVSRDPDPPYDRTAVSKGYLGGEKSREDVLLGGAGWYDEHNVELLTRTSAMKLDTEAHTVTLANKDVLRYGKLLLATGANVRRLRLDGCDLDGIHYLRALGNADAIRTDTEGAEHVVLVGGSYIATEVAATLTALGRKCALVMQEDVTLERGFGKAAGGFFQKVLEDHGVEIYAGEDVERFEGEGRVATVVTKSGKRIPADAVIVGAGVTPDVMLAQARRASTIGERGGVLTDATLATSAPDVFAAGDIAEYESVIHGGAARPDRALGRRREPGQDRRARDARPPDSRTTRSRTSSPTCPTGRGWSTSARPTAGPRRSCAARSRPASSPSTTSTATASPPR